jgi:transaldolase
MQIFLDSADVVEIERWLEYGVIDGVTTNPSIMLKDGVYDAERGAREIANLINPCPMCVQVTTNNLDEMVQQAREFSRWAPNIVVKIPVINKDGLPCLAVIRQAQSEGVVVNAVVVLSLGQVILAAKAGATYISIFAGRIGDEGGNAPEVIRQSVDWLRHWEYRSKVVVGSIRSVADILQAATAGAHIITIPPPLLAKMVEHKFTRATVAQFTEDARKAEEMMEREAV